METPGDIIDKLIQELTTNDCTVVTDTLKSLLVYGMHYMSKQERQHMIDTMQKMTDQIKSNSL